MDYEYLKGFVTPAYSYIEGDEKIRPWKDSQNCYYHILLTEDEELIDGKNWWIIEPMKPKGIVINNQEEWDKYIKWFVSFSSISEDEKLEWDFKTNKPIKNESNIS